MSISLTLEEKTMELVKRVQDLESQRLGRAATLEETIAAMSVLYIEKNDPMEKAKRAIAKTERVTAKTGPNCTDVTRHTNTRRHHIPAVVEHKVVLRDGGQCTGIDSKGLRCEQRHWLHIHHVNPVSTGGGNTAENLTTLCSAHHRMSQASQTRNDSSRYSKH